MKNEFNVLDLSDFINIFLKHKFRHEQFDQMMQETYDSLKRNIDEVCF